MDRLTDKFLWSILANLIFGSFCHKTDEHVLGKASNNQTGWQHQFYGAFLRRAFPVFKKIINFYQTL